MKNSFLLVCASSFAISCGFGCSSTSNSATDSGTTIEDTGTPGSDGGDDSSTADTGTPSSDGGDDSSPATDTGTPATDGGGLATTCSNGTLFAGNPDYEGEPLDRPASGTGILANPPFQWQNMVFSGGWLYSRDSGELWGVDLSAGAPVEKRLAGLNRTDANYGYGAGPCATARFGRLEGMASLPDKSLVVADALGNGVLHVVDPTGTGCKVEYWAGNTKADPDFDPFVDPPNAGDVDGPGASAKLDTPGAITTDDAGNAYFFDQANKKVKKIANDSVHTVSTLVKLPASDAPYRITNMTRIGTKLYGIGTDGTKAYVVSVDTGTGALATVISGGGGSFPPIDSTAFPALAGITTDGTGLIIAGQGYVWYLTTTGTLTLLAGTGMHIDFPPSGYDAKASHPAKSLALQPAKNGSSIGSSDYVTYFAGAIYYRGHGDGTAAFIEKIACP